MSVIHFCKCYNRKNSVFRNIFKKLPVNKLAVTFSTLSLVKEKVFDIVIIGGGIVGLATALRLKNRLPAFKVAVLEKESYLAAHQSGHNGGVIHSGIYYKPGTLKAKLCVEGMKRMYKYCEENGILHKKNGKLIVAVNSQEIKWLEKLYQNAIKNNVFDVKMIDSKEISEIEPHCKGLKAIYSPNTGVVNFADVTRNLGHRFRDLGGNILLNFCVNAIREVKEGDGTTHNDSTNYPVEVFGSKGTVRARFVIACAGLHSDTVAVMTGESEEPKIIPIRGEYFFLANDKKNLVNGNIYQVPNPNLPFHGVHLTSQIDGKVWVGPVSMIASRKEGYSWSNLNYDELWKLLTYRGAHLFIKKNFTPCLYEFLTSINGSVTLKRIQQYIPQLKTSDLVPGASIGVQAHAMNMEGDLVDEFKFIERKRILHCRNMPSPAATSSLAIASYITGKVQKLLEN